MADEEKQPPRAQDVSLKVPMTPEGIEAELEPAEDVDPALADWLSVDARHATTEESETEPESDVDSVNDDIGKDTDEWTEVRASGSETLESFQTLASIPCPPPQQVVYVS